MKLFALVLMLVSIKDPGAVALPDLHHAAKKTSRVAVIC